MPELRRNPLNGEWIIVATNRQQRPHLPKDQCPFCPGSTNVPSAFDVLAYPNDFPALSASADKDVPMISDESGLFTSAPAYGHCEVILYSPEHHKKIYDLSSAHMKKLTELWKERFVHFSKDIKIKYVFEFENRGAEVGVTIDHPHGQLYAYPFVPPKIEKELTECRKYHEKHQVKLLDKIAEAEVNSGQRMVWINESFCAFIPWFTDYPFGVFIVSRNSRAHIGQMSDKELQELGETIQAVTRGFDQIFERPFPYMMCFHQTPVNSPEWNDSEKYYTFHIEFYPPLRERDKIKWYAGSEMGAGVAANPMDVDQCAAILRDKTGYCS